MITCQCGHVAERHGRDPEWRDSSKCQQCKCDAYSPVGSPKVIEEVLRVTRDQADQFLIELESLMRKHDVSISHEDGHGAFLLEPFDEFNLKWIRNAFID